MNVLHPIMGLLILVQPNIEDVWPKSNLPGHLVVACEQPYITPLIIMTDIDECSLDTDMCAQICRDTAGSYTCDCSPGYTLSLNGRDCNGNTLCTMHHALWFLLRNFLFPIDINECAMGTDLCVQNCRNVNGSYACTCNPGYRLNTDGQTCDGM